MRDIATSLPPEIWLLIFDELSCEDILQLRLVHPVLHGYLQQRVWATLTLCTLEENHYARSKAVLRNPALAPLVQHLCLAPFSFHRRADTRTNLWICDPPIQNWSGLIRNLQWRRPLRSIKWYRQSRKGIEVGVNVTSRLTNIRQLSLSFSFPEGFHPNPEPYRRILGNLQTGKLQTLDLHFTSTIALQVFGEALRGTLVTIENLQTLVLDIRTRWYWEHAQKYGDQDFQTDIQNIANLGRNTLCSLRVSVGKVPYLSNLRPLFHGLGVFPNLEHFSFSFVHDREDDHITEFLRQHRSHLVSIELQNIIHRLLTLVDPDDAEDRRLMPQLETINLCNRHYDLGPTWSLSKLRLRSYADSLTTLLISSWWFHPRSRFSLSGNSGRHGFTYEDVKELLLSLYRPDRGILLRKLRIPLVGLSPELFDLMSVYLNQLDALDISYYELVGQKGDIRETKAKFWRNMSTRRYSNWGLKAICMNRATSRLYSNYAPNQPVMRLIARRIPSVKEFGPFSWSADDWH